MPFTPHIVTATPTGGASVGASPAVGTVFQAVVHESNVSPFLLMAGRRVELPPETAAFTGARVSVEVLQTEPALQLRLSPAQENATPQTAMTGDQERVLTLARAALDILGATGVSAADLAAIAPDIPSLSASAMRQLFALFLTRESLGASLDTLAELLRLAGDAAVSAPESLLAFLNARDGSADSIAALLAALRQAQGAEARLAAGLTGNTLEQALRQAQASLRSQIAALPGNAALAAFMRARGLTRRFETVVRETLERLDAAETQNLHGLRRPYVFLEAPVSPELGVTRAHLHFFPDGRKQADPRRANARGGTAALDVETSALGSLWIELTTADAQCLCVFKTERANVATLLREEADALQTGLETAGYAQAEVRIALWDGNRLRETGALMRRFAALNLSG